LSYSIQRVWTGDSIILNRSGSYKDTYTTSGGSGYNYTDQTSILVENTILHKANFSYISNTTIIGNLTVDINVNVYKVDIDYGDNVKVIWVAFKQGTLVMDYYLSSYIQNFSYYEEYHQDIESEFKKFNWTTRELLDTWNSTDDIQGEKDYEYTNSRTRYPYFAYTGIDGEFSLPIILTIQIFTTEKKDRIAWANMLQDFKIYKDLDKNMIYSIADKDSLHSVPGLHSSNEFSGYLQPYVCDYERNLIEYDIESGDVWYNYSNRILYPRDRSVNDLASTINFTAPTAISDTNISWGIQYPEYPTYAYFMENYANEFSTPLNSAYIHSCPTDYSYEFDYGVGENYTNLDITWEIGKITNTSLYNLVQGYGLTFPQYNYFLASFDIDEIDTKELTVPCDKFSFKSNDTLVANINMGGPNKKNYTLYDYPTAGINTEFESQGGSIHPIVIAFDELDAHSGEPFVNCLYTLGDIVAQDPTFGVEDSLYRLETQNYPIWSGERLQHDPTLTVYYEPYEQEVSDSGIPGYDLIVILGIAGVITTIIVLKRRKLRFKT